MIDYNHLIDIILSENSDLGENVIRKCFDLFSHHKGYITIDEFKEIFQGKNIINEEDWEDKLFEIQTMNDSKISYITFKILLLG